MLIRQCLLQEVFIVATTLRISENYRKIEFGPRELTLPNLVDVLEGSTVKCACGSLNQLLGITHKYLIQDL